MDAVTDSAARKALTALDRQIEAARVVNDPALPILEAMGEVVQSLDRVDAQIAAFEPSLSERDLTRLARSAAHGAGQHALMFARAQSWRNLALAALIGFAIGAAGFMAGRQSSGNLASQCLAHGQVRADNGKAYCVVWLDRN